MGLAFGLTRSDGWADGTHFAYVPATATLVEGAVTLHFNLGWSRERETARDRITWGAAAVTGLGPGLTGFVEPYGDDVTPAFLQTGLSISIIPDLVHLDFTGGRQSSRSGSSFFSVGVDIYLPPFH